MYVLGVQNEGEVLKEELAEAKAENDRLRLQLNNVMLLLKMEMTTSGNLPKLVPTIQYVFSGRRAVDSN